MKVYVALFENALFGGTCAEVFSSREAAEFCIPNHDSIEVCEIDELVQDLDPGDTAKLQDKLNRPMNK